MKVEDSRQFLNELQEPATSHDAFSDSQSESTGDGLHFGDFDLDENTSTKALRIL
jgi:hypothetical protein